MIRPLRVAWYATKGQHSNYSVKVVRTWFERHGALTVAAEDSPDLLCATCSHPRDYPTLGSARKLADAVGVPLLVGGHDAYTGATLLAWGDFVCVGEGYRLVEGLATEGASDPRGYLQAAPNVMHRGAPGALVRPDYHTPFREVPAIQTADLSYYALAGRGCHRKCKFCMTTWVQPHQTAGAITMARVERGVEKHTNGKAGVVFVTNDEGAGRWAGSITVQRVLAGYREEWPMVLRVGVEGITEDRRAWFGKPVTDADLATLFPMAAEKKRQLQLFYIIGFPDDPPPDVAFEPLAELIPVEAIRHPRIWLKFTYFDAPPHTPLARWDTRQLTEWDATVALTSLRRKSGRFRAFKAAAIGGSVWATVARRMEPDVVFDWGRREQEMKGRTVAEVCAEAERIGGRGLVDGTGSYPWERILTSTKSSNLDDGYSPADGRGEARYHAPDVRMRADP